MPTKTDILTLIVYLSCLVAKKNLSHLVDNNNYNEQTGKDGAASV